MLPSGTERGAGTAAGSTMPGIAAGASPASESRRASIGAVSAEMPSSPVASTLAIARRYAPAGMRCSSIAVVVAGTSSCASTSPLVVASSMR